MASIITRKTLRGSQTVLTPTEIAHEPAELNDHVDSTANPHSVTAGQAGAAPTTHATQHQNGGADEVSVAGLSGELADPQTPKVHGSTHTNGTDDVPDVVGDAGAGGTHGLVPAPGAGDAAAGKFLKADGTWATPAGADDDESEELAWDPGEADPSEVYLSGCYEKVWELDNGKNLYLSFRLPDHADISAVNPRLRVPLIVSDTGAGNGTVSLDLNVKYMATGELANKVDDETLNQTPTITDTLYRVHEVEFTLDRTKMAAGDKIGIELQRAAGGTYTGEIGIRQHAQFVYRNGG